MKRQGQVVAGLFAQGPERLEEALKIAQTATGSAMREHERSMDSVAFKAQVAANEMTKFWQTTVNSESIKMFYDSLAGIARGLTAISNSIGLLPVILGLATVALIFFNNAIKASATNLLIMLRHTILVRLGLAPTIVTTNALTAAFWNLNFSLVGVTTALRGLMVTAGVFLLPVAAIVGITFGITKLTSAIMKNREETKNLEEYNKNLVRSWSLHKKETEDLINRYNSLSNIKRSDLSVEQEQEYLDVQNKLGELLPNLVDHIDEKGQAHLKNSEAIKEELKYLDKLINLEKQRQVAAFRDEVSSADKDIQKKQREIAQRERAGYMQGSEKYVKNEMAILKLEKEIAELTDDIEKNLLNVIKVDLELDDIKLDPTLSKSLDEVVEKLDVTKDNAESLKDTLVALFTGLSLSPNFINTQEFIDLLDQLEITDVDKVINFVLNIEGIQVNDDINNQIKDITKDLNLSEKDASEFKKSLIDIFKLVSDNSDFTSWKAFSDLLSDLKDKGNLTEEQVKALEKVFNDVSEANKKANNELSTFRKTLSETQGVMSSSFGEIEKVKKALNEYDETGKFNISTIVELAKEHGHLLEVLNDEEALHRELSKIIQDKEEVARKAYTQMIMNSKNFYSENILANTELIERFKTNYQIDLTRWSSHAKAKLAIDTELIKGLAGMWAKFFNAQGEFIGKFLDEASFPGGKEHAMDGYGNVVEVTPEMKEQLKEFNEQMVLRRKAAYELGKIAEETGKSLAANLDFSGIGASNKKDKSGSKDEFTKTFELWKIKLDQINQTITEINDKIEDATDYDEKSKLYDQLIEAQNLKLQILKEIKEFQSSELETVKNQLKKSLSAKDYENLLKGDISNLDLKGDSNKKIAELVDKFISLASAINSTTNEINGMDNTIRDTISNSLDNLYNKLDTTFNELENKIKTVNNEMSLLQDYQVDEKAEKTKTLFDLYEQQANAVILNVKRLNEEFNNLTKKGLDENSDAWKKNKEKLQEWLDMGFNVSGMVKDLIDQIANEVIEIYKETYKQQEKIASDSIDKQIKAEEKRHKKVMDDLEKETNAFEELINAKLRLIEDKSDEEDYDRELAKKQKEEQDISNQINVLELDNSIEAKAKRTTLLKELAEKQEEIEIFMNERSKDLQKQNLKDQSDTYKKEVDLKKDAEDSKHDLIKENLEEEKEAIKLHYDNLINDERKFAQIRKDIISGNLDNIKTDFDLFAAFIKTNMEGIGASIGLNLIDQINNALKGINYNIPNPTSPPSSSPTDPTSPARQNSYTVNTWGHTYVISNKGHTITKNGQYVPVENFGHLPPEVLDIARKMKLGEMHEGGIVGNQSNTPKLTQLVNKLFNTNSSEQIVKMLKGELAIPGKNITKNFIPNMKKFANSFTSQIPAVAGDNIYKLNINIENITGDKKGGQVVVDTIINGVNKLGGRFK